MRRARQEEKIDTPNLVLKSVDFRAKLRCLIQDVLQTNQLEFAKSIGISQGYLSEILSGKATISAGALAGIYMMNPAYLDDLLMGVGEHICLLNVEDTHRKFVGAAGHSEGPYPDFRIVDFLDRLKDIQNPAEAEKMQFLREYGIESASAVFGTLLHLRHCEKKSIDYLLTGEGAHEAVELSSLSPEIREILDWTIHSPEIRAVLLYIKEKELRPLAEKYLGERMDDLKRNASKAG